MTLEWKLLCEKFSTVSLHQTKTELEGGERKIFEKKDLCGKIRWSLDWPAPVVQRVFLGKREGLNSLPIDPPSLNPFTLGWFELMERCTQQNEQESVFKLMNVSMKLYTLSMLTKQPFHQSYPSSSSWISPFYPLPFICLLYNSFKVVSTMFGSWNKKKKSLRILFPIHFLSQYQLFLSTRFFLSPFLPPNTPNNLMFK